MGAAPLPKVRFTVHHFYRTKNTVPDFLGPQKFFRDMRNSIRSKDGRRSLYAVSLKKNAFHKVQSSTMDTEELAKISRQESSTIKKERKQGNFFMFLAAIMLTNPPIDRNVCSPLS